MVHDVVVEGPGPRPERVVGVRADPAARVSGESSSAAVDQHDVTQCRQLLGVVPELLPPLARRDQHADVAVVEDVGDLVRLEHRVHGHEDAARRGGPEDRHDGLDALVEQIPTRSPLSRPMSRSPDASARHAAYRLA